MRYCLILHVYRKDGNITRTRHSLALGLAIAD
jgi:hypothetical protein